MRSSTWSGTESQDSERQDTAPPVGRRRRRGRRPRVEEAEPRVLQRADHPISRQLVDSNAIKVLYRLHNAGYRAYLVGGGVRDLMLGRQPKDFDVSTDAQPNEIRRLFRNARIIGRRFRLAHILFREGVVEVATFRRAPDPQAQKGSPGDLLITSDNSFGTPRQDAFRRDFTINGLFYNIADFTVIDYLGGIEDLERGIVRVIGDPAVRFQEDPVRMLRACEFAGRLGFTIETRTQQGIYDCRKQLLKAAPPRLTEELLQLLVSGRAAASVQWMLELGLLDVLLPELMAMIHAQQRGMGSFGNVLNVLDRMAAAKKSASDVVLLGSALLPHIMSRRFEAEMRDQRAMSVGRFARVVSETLDRFVERFAVPNFKRARLEQTLEGFHRLCEPGWSAQQRLRFAGKSYFDESLQLFTVLVQATGEGEEALSQWQQAQQRRPRQPPSPRKDKGDSRPRRRRRRRRRR